MRSLSLPHAGTLAALLALSALLYERGIPFSEIRSILAVAAITNGLLFDATLQVGLFRFINMIWLIQVYFYNEHWYFYHAGLRSWGRRNQSG